MTVLAVTAAMAKRFLETDAIPARPTVRTGTAIRLKGRLSGRLNSEFRSAIR